ncbi:MAG: carboxypeptidase regulatory-like domain-containing protein [Blastocatellia bacterium]
MNKLRLMMACGFACACALMPIAAQEAPRAAVSKSITGRVINDEGQPVANATVSVGLVGANRRANNTLAMTDAEGNFKAEVPASGLYQVFAFAPAYVPEPGEDAFSGRLCHAGESVTVRLIRGGVITGRVLNQAGEPLCGVPVQAHRVRDAAGRTELIAQGGNSDITDDRGIYRIYGLLPGAYLVSAGDSGQGYLNPYSTAGRIYYPSAVRDNAAEISVQAGAETTGIDIRWRNERGSVVSGMVKSADGGEPAGNLWSQIVLTSATTGSREAAANVMPGAPAGFALYGVSDGEYEIFATAQVREQFLMSPPRRITVSGRDVSGLELLLLPMASVAGKVTLESLPPDSRDNVCKGSGAAQLSDLLIGLERQQSDRPALETFYTLRPQRESPNEQGEFSFNNLLPGRWQLRAQILSECCYLKSVARSETKASAANNLNREPLTLRSGEKLTGLSVVVAEGAAQVKGKVIAAGTKLPSRVRVFLIPAAKEAADDLLRYAEAKADSDGAFSFSSLAPGRYLLLARAVDADESDEKPARPLAWDNAERLKLRKAAEAANISLELQPCQRVTDFKLKYAVR